MKVSIMTPLKKTIIILLFSPIITLFACVPFWWHSFGLLFWQLGLAALLNPGFLGSSHDQWHTRARQIPQVGFPFWFSEFSVFLLLLLFLSHLTYASLSHTRAVLYSIHNKSLFLKKWLMSLHNQKVKIKIGPEELQNAYLLLWCWNVLS